MNLNDDPVPAVQPTASAHEQTARAMRVERAGASLQPVIVPTPRPGDGQVLIRVHACGVCRTDVHIIDRDLRDARYPLVPGHEIVGRVVQNGPGASRFRIGDRVGVPWLGWTCGTCAWCRSDRENLCVRARFTGYQIDGGYAEYALADERYCLPIPGHFRDLDAAPLLCAGLIGYRSLRMAGEAERVGLYGFGAAAHLVAQIARHRGQRVYAFTRAGDIDAQRLARRLGAVWAGDSAQAPPEPLDAAVLFAPVGALVVAALRALAPGGTVVCGGIHMSDIPSFPYELLWGERVIRSVANLTRRDGVEFMALLEHMSIEVAVQPYSLERAVTAIDDLRAGRVAGAAVLEIVPSV